MATLDQTIKKARYMKTSNFIFVFLMVLFFQDIEAQSIDKNWIRPANAKSEALWGIGSGIVFGIWPTGVEGDRENTGGPRG